MKEFYVRFFLVNTKNYYNLGFDLEINKLLIFLLPVVIFVFVAYHVYRNHTFTLVKRLSRRGAMTPEGAKTLKDLGLGDKKLIRWMLSGDGQITRLVKRKGEPEYTYEEYTAMQKSRKKDEKIDFETAEFYLNGTETDRITRIVNRYEVRPVHTVLMCVFIVVAFVCAMLLMPEILTGIDWLVGYIKGVAPKV